MTTTPAGITRRTCTLGTFMTNETGDDLGGIVLINASRPNLVWSATGQALIADTRRETFQPGSEVSFSLIPTDLPGWMINGRPIDMTGGKQSHTYDITVQPQRRVGAAMVNVGVPLVLKGVVIPSGAGALDLDLAAQTTTANGVVISIPDYVSQLQAAVEDSAARAEAAAIRAEGVAAIDDTDSAFTALFANGASDTRKAVDAVYAPLAYGHLTDPILDRAVSNDPTLKGNVQVQGDVSFHGNATVGDSNKDVVFTQSVTLDTDTRTVVLTYTNGVLTLITELDGQIVVKSMTLNYTGSNLTSVTEIAGGVSVTTVFAYAADNSISSMTRSVSN